MDETDYTFALVASGTDIPEKERNRIVWMWKSTQKSNSTDNRVSKTVIYTIWHGIHWEDIDGLIDIV